MINVTDKTDCCGCTACAAVCPQNCIRMVPDEDGFLYPAADHERCIHCERCIKVCPVRGKEKKRYDLQKSKEEVTRAALQEQPLPLAYVGYYHDDAVRQKSTSGGLFTALAKYVLDRKGVVYGAGFDERFHIRHAAADSEETIAAFRGSKYVQSDQNGIDRAVKNDLMQGKMVLYTGTPCQVAGLQQFLGKEYDNLITADVFCHGVGSPAFWDKYLAYMTGKYHAPVKELYFREKTYGYNSACMAVYFQNGKSSHRDHDSDWYWSPFSKCYVFRPSCYACAFKTIHHTADFSIGDYWQTAALEQSYAQAEGCTLLICHSEKSKQILSAVKDTVELTEVPLYEALLVNGGHQPSMFITSSRQPEQQETFMFRSRTEPIVDLVREYMPLSFKTKLKCRLKPILYRTGVLKLLKR